MTLVMDSTYIYSDPDALTGYTAPTEFDEGGLGLSGGETKHITFEIVQTPDMPDGADLMLHANVGLIEDNSQDYRSFNTGYQGNNGTIRVQAPAYLSVVSLANGAPNAPYVNYGQFFPIAFEAENTGDFVKELKGKN